MPHVSSNVKNNATSFHVANGSAPLNFSMRFYQSSKSACLYHFKLDTGMSVTAATFSFNITNVVNATIDFMMNGKSVDGMLVKSVDGPVVRRIETTGTAQVNVIILYESRDASVSFSYSAHEVQKLANDTKVTGSSYNSIDHFALGNDNEYSPVPIILVFVSIVVVNVAVLTVCYCYFR